MDVNGRYHTHIKEVLRFEDLDLNIGEAGVEFTDFMKYVDDIEKPDPDSMPSGQWKKLFAFLRTLANKTGVNYCIYQNRFNVFFDVTSHCLGTGDEILEEDDDNSGNPSAGKEESAIDKLKRYKYELDQVDMKIAHLQKRRQEYVGKIEPLRAELASLLDDLSGYGG
jgi:hypothetical protein